jgi:ABC-type Co2+ transport system permease subunit
MPPLFSLPGAPVGNGGFRESLAEFLGIFAFTQVPLAIIGGLLTVVVIKGWKHTQAGACRAQIF